MLRTFRNSDIVARLGGDEFAILAQNVPHHEVETVTARLEGKLCAENKLNEHSYQLSLSVGAVWIAYDSNLSIDQLVDQADKAMYDHKRSKKQLANSIVQVGFGPNRYRRLRVV